MSTRDRVLRHIFDGGWATDFGPTAEIGLDDSGLIRIPYLVNAENLLFEFDGGPHKIGGTNPINSSVIESGEQIRGLFDYWKLGTSGSSTQKRIIHAGTKVLKDDADGSFSSIITGLEDDTITSCITYEDVAIITSSSTVDVPKKYDGTTVSTLGTNTPLFSFACTHRDNRVWAAGDAANPSRLYYSPVLTDSGADGDWTDGGHIDIDPSDGDKITGIASHKDDIWVFKGPYFGSIHRISGTSESDYARHTFIRGLGAIGHNSIFRYRDDLGFVWVDGSVHSLAATAAYGDYNEATLSYPINGYIREHVNHARLPWASAATEVMWGIVIFTMPFDTSTDNNVLLVMDYRFNPARWSYIPAIEAACVAQVTDASGTHRPGVMIGGNDGYVRKILQTDRSLDGATAYTAKVTTPFVNYGNPINMKTISRASVGIAPKGGYDMTFAWTRDDNAQQTYTVSQSGGDVLGGSISSGIAGSFTTGDLDPTNVRCTTGGAHGLSAGDDVVIYETTNYDGQWTITFVANANKIEFDATYVGDENPFPAAYWEGPQFSNPFILDTSVLGGSSFVDRFMSLEEGGEFRSIQYEMSNGGNFEDMEIHSFSASVYQGADSGEN